MKKLLAALALLLTFTAFNAAAQTVPTPDAATLKAANEMLEAMNYRAMMKAGIGQMRQAMPAMMKQGMTAAINNDASLDATQKLAKINLLDADIQKHTATMDSIFDDPTLMNEMAQNAAIIYARHFTGPEMRQIAAFYKSPIGVKMLATMPQMMGETMQMSQSIMAPRIEAMMKKMQAERANH